MASATTTGKRKAPASESKGKRGGQPTKKQKTALAPPSSAFSSGAPKKTIYRPLAPQPELNTNSLRGMGSGVSGNNVYRTATYSPHAGPAAHDVNGGAAAFSNAASLYFTPSPAVRWNDSQGSSSAIGHYPAGVGYDEGCGRLPHGSSANAASSSSMVSTSSMSDFDSTSTDEYGMPQLSYRQPVRSASNNFPGQEDYSPGNAMGYVPQPGRSNARYHAAIASPNNLPSPTANSTYGARVAPASLLPAPASPHNASPQNNGALGASQAPPSSFPIDPDLLREEQQPRRSGGMQQLPQGAAGKHGESASDAGTTVGNSIPQQHLQQSDSADGGGVQDEDFDFNASVEDNSPSGFNLDTALSPQGY